MGETGGREAHRVGCEAHEAKGSDGNTEHRWGEGLLWGSKGTTRERAERTGPFDSESHSDIFIDNGTSVFFWRWRLLIEEVPTRVYGRPVDAYFVMKVRIRAFPCISHIGDLLIFLD